MKITKMLVCLFLLAAIICGSVAMAQATDAQIAEKESQESPAPTLTLPDENTAEKEEQQKEEEVQIGSVTVQKTYSEGLRFRSNGDGTCAVSGLGSCRDTCVLIPPKSPAGDTVTEILPYAFQNSTIGVLEIPATVTTLSAISLAGCASLAYIRVEGTSASFCEYDGALYSKDGTALIYCPAARSKTNLRLSPTISTIKAGALAECTTLSTVSFSGGAEKWHAVIVGDDNAPLYNASLRFTATA